MKKCVVFSVTACLVRVSAFQPGSSLHATSSILHYGPKSTNTEYKRRFSRSQEALARIPNDATPSDDKSNSLNILSKAIQNPIVPSTIAFFYWYLLVFGAAAEANGLPVPSFIPMVPGWPPSDQDLVPVIEDSVHFFYISDALQALSGDSSSVELLPQLRLAFFNIAEAYIFAFLPLLLADKKRLPLPVVIGTWFGALGLTNAFLAPYLALRQFLMKNNDEVNGEDRSIDIKALNVGFGVIASSVVGFAVLQTILTTASTPVEWLDFFNLVKTDRTYLAFAVDLVLFACFQIFLLDELNLQNGKRDTNGDYKKENIPFVGILAWLFK